MTKQEKIRVGMVKFVKREATYPNWKPERLVDVLLYYQKSQGAKIKCDRELPNEVLCEDGTLAWVEEII